jgi:hypothetical protein
MMLALVYEHASKTLKVANDYPRPEPGSTEALVKVHRSGESAYLLLLPFSMYCCWAELTWCWLVLAGAGAEMSLPDLVMAPSLPAAVIHVWHVFLAVVQGCVPL